MALRRTAPRGENSVALEVTFSSYDCVQRAVGMGK